MFQTVPPTLTQPPPALIRHTNLPYTQLTGLNKYQKGDFTSSTIAFYQKSIFDFYMPLQIYQVILMYGIFSGSILDNLE